MRFGITIIAVMLGLVLLACQGSPASPAPEETTGPDSDGEGHTASLGEELFISKGCVACHGEGGEGTEIAPALPGHSRNQVLRQVRAPVGTMPVFPPDKISDEELDAIADWVESLEGSHAHRAVGIGDQMVMHHWMALYALEADDQAEAIHHLDHLIELTEGPHLAKMTESKGLVESGDLHEGAHIIEEMLSGIDPGLTGEATTHLRLSISALRVDEVEDAAHHLEHFVEVSTGQDAEKGGEILALMEAGNLQDVEHELRELLGEEAPADDHGDGDGHAHDDGHEDDHASDAGHDDGMDMDDGMDADGHADDGHAH